MLLDISNPLDGVGRASRRTLFVKDDDSLAETIQRAHPDARVVKSLNTMNNSLMVDPQRLGEDTTVFVSGDDADAKATVTALLRQLGHGDVIDLGGIETARGPEMCAAALDPDQPRRSAATTSTSRSCAGPSLARLAIVNQTG